MPPNEQMFQFHGYSGPCPASPKLKPVDDKLELEDARRMLAGDQLATLMCKGWGGLTERLFAAACADFIHEHGHTILKALERANALRHYRRSAGHKGGRMIINKALLKHAQDLAKSKVDLILERDAAFAQHAEQAAEIAKLRVALDTANNNLELLVSDEHNMSPTMRMIYILAARGIIDAALAASEVG